MEEKQTKAENLTEYSKERAELAEHLEEYIQNLTQESSFSARDKVLSRFLTLKDLINDLSEELSGLKKEVESYGTCSTRNFIVSVSERSRTSAPSLKELKKLWPEVVNHTKTTTYPVIEVKRKDSK